MKALIYGIKNSIYEIIYFIISTLATLFIRKLLIENIHIEVVALQQVINQILTIVTLVEFRISSIMLFYLYPPLKRGNKKKINDIMNAFRDKYKTIAIVVLLIGLVFIPFIQFFIINISFQVNYILIYLMLLILNVYALLLTYKILLLDADQKKYIYLRVLIFFKLIYLVIAYLNIKFTSNIYLHFLIYCICEALIYFTISKKVDKEYDYLKKDKNKNKKYDKEIAKYIKSTGVSKIFSQLTGSVDIFVIGFLSNGYILSLYSNYFSVFTSLYTIIQRIFSSFKATIAKYMDSKSKEYSREIFKLFDLSGYTIGLISSLVFYLTIDYIITIWIGEKYILGQYIPLLLSIQLFTYVYRMCMWNTLGIKGWFDVSKVSDSTGTILNFILSIVLYMKLGLPGIIIATIISQIVQYLIEAKYVLKKFKLLNINVIIEKILLVFSYIVLLIFIKNHPIISIVLGLFILIYLIILFRGRCKYVLKSQKNN